MAAFRWGEDAHLFAIAVIAFGLGINELFRSAWRDLPRSG